MNIPKRHSHCMHAGEPLLPLSIYITYLEEEEKGWQRFDYCLSCWNKLGKKGIHWKSKVPERKEKKLKSDERALAFFKTEGMDKKTHFLLALYLERNKQLLRKEAEGLKIFFELAETGEVFIVEKVLLNKEDIQTCLNKFLETSESTLPLIEELAQKP